MVRRQHKGVSHPPGGIERRMMAGISFNSEFFRVIFPTRIRSFCAGRTDGLPVVHLQLTDDCVLDLCHIEQLAPGWMAAAVFRDSATCSDMDLVFVPYATILRITLTRQDIARRRVGFQVDAPAPKEIGSCNHESSDGD